MKKCDNSDDLYLYPGNVYWKVQFIEMTTERDIMANR